MSKKRLTLSMMLAMTMVSFGLGDSLHLTEADNGRTNSVNAGSEIKIVLEGNPTTGYSWDAALFSTNKLQQIGTVEYRPTEQSDGRPRVGTGGQFVFRFKAVGSGQGQIKLIYRRSWETTAHDKVYSVVIDVK